MRIHFKGSVRPPEPLVVQLTNAIPFEKAEYEAEGYLYYDVLCIGAAGGPGGGQGWTSPGYSNIMTSGGAGGGGGSQLVEGLALASLPSSAPVVVGVGGAAGTFVNPPTASTAAGVGGDGGYSSFNGTTCRASGGKGGKIGNTSSAVGGYGGDGGAGNRTTAGGGAIAATTGYADGVDGTWDPVTKIGKGGAGGIAGSGVWPTPTLYVPPKLGGRGAYLSTDQRLTAPRTPLITTGQVIERMGGGGAGGATAAIFNNQPMAYGTGSTSLFIIATNTTPNGAVFLRLYAE
jgi:hypothetical protein